MNTRINTTIAEIAMATPRPPTHGELLRALEKARLLGVQDGIDMAVKVHDRVYAGKLAVAL